MKAESSRTPVTGVRWAQSTAVVNVEGEIDLSRSLEFQQSLLEVLDRKPDKIVIDLAKVGYMDSSGVASLVKVLSRTRKSGTSLHLAAMTHRVRSIFEITRLDTVFEIFPTVEEAMV